MNTKMHERPYQEQLQAVMPRLRDLMLFVLTAERNANLNDPKDLKRVLDGLEYALTQL